MLWGCGTSDMKSGLAVMLALACGVPDPAVDVTWVFYEAEEVDARFNGLGRLFGERPELLRGDVALLGEPTDGVIEAGCQGTMRLRVMLRGARGPHRPARGWDATPSTASGALLDRLARYEGRQPVIDGCEYREALQAVQVEGGVAGNVVPDEAVLLVNHRFAPDRSPAEAEAHLRELLLPVLEADDELAVVDCADGAAPGLEHPLLASLIARNGLTVRAKLGWTDVARFAAHGIPAANFGPGDATLAHTADERVAREPIERTYSALADLLRAGI